MIASTSIAARGHASQAASAVLAACCALAGAWLALRHVSPAWALAAFIAWTAACFWRPGWWLVVLPALIPAIGFTPWTGSLFVEEWDLLVLGVAAAGYAAYALRTGARAEVHVLESWPLWWTAVALFAASTAIALGRGLVDAGPLEPGVWQGYYDPLNSVRVPKGFAFALLLAPLLRAEVRRDGARALDRLTLGLALACGTVALFVLWERTAFPGLFNFSTDYRVTGPFWEMHVGGAALDGCLVLTLPFVLLAVRQARNTPFLLAMLVVLGLAAYACLVTFSRGVYLALPVALAVLWLARRAHGHRWTWQEALGAVAFCVIAAAASSLAFSAGGYRALGASLGVLALGMLIERAWPTGSGTRGASIVAGAVAAAIAWGLAGLLPKGPYVMYAAAWIACAALLARLRGTGGDALRPFALAAFVAVAVMAVAVPVHWAGPQALVSASAAVGVMIVLAIATGRALSRVQVSALHARMIALGGAGAIALVVAVFAGGAYMAERFASGSSDLDERVHHWRDGLAMLDGATDWLLGKGLGRFPENYLFRVRDSVSPGSYRLESGGRRAHLTLSGPRYETSFGDLFRVSQQLPARPGRYLLTLSARATEAVRLHVEICEKHMLYNGACALASLPVPATQGEWRAFAVSLDGAALTGGPWYAPRVAYLALAVETSGKSLDLAGLSLTDAQHREVLANGDFAQGTARWFFSSDRYHLPWHIKSLPLNVLYEQGLVGLALFVLIVLLACWRLLRERAASHPAAPFIVSALAGFVAVGAFDSLTDVPRLAFLFYLVLFASTGITVPPPARRV